MIWAVAVLGLLVAVLTGILARSVVEDQAARARAEFGADRLLRERLREDVIVTTKTGEAFRGVLYDSDSRSLILRDVKMLNDSSARPVPVDGELIVDRAQVDYFQRP